ncbi:AraC-type DNA-binding protein [Chryseolinea serpens]|uniref:AraC-type DNA-binding protein n=1 Tax=Chryseolinea serpens TaxID=947013 RepID=A0A1M5WNQ7_9BACT|nr:AraC family transcriptional regulator [Chryseolinea serpens]SHH89121.1 AraC-type DNA-binding protein [Chryseolinea serpens]
MDKIDTANWNNYFDTAEVAILHASERYSETLSSFKEPGLASGKVHAVATPGMVLTEFCLQANNPFQLLDTEPKEAAESVFILNGDVESHFPYLKDPVYFNSQHHNLQYSTQFAGNHIIHTGNFHALTITYDLPYLNGLLQCHENGSLEALSKNLYKKENFLAANHPVGWDSQIAEVIQSIRHCQFQGPTRYIFLESKMLELFVLQMEHLHALQTASGKESWRREDKEKMLAVKEYIERSYLEPLTLKELTYAFGLNEFKLKKGYRHFFNTTVFGHILQLRMQKAQHLLSEHQMTISEVAQFVGYNNTGSFSYEYKKRFGHSPSQVRNSSSLVSLH